MSNYIPDSIRHRFNLIDFLQKGGKKKRAEMIARSLANRPEMELIPPERVTPELVMPQLPPQTQATPIQPNTQFIDNLQIKGNNPSIVDYLNSTGRNSSLSARRDLGATFGIDNVGTAEGNIRLLKILQEQDGYVAPVYVPPSVNPKRKSVDPWAAAQIRYDQRQTGSGTVPEGWAVEARPAVIVPSSTGQVVAVNPSSSFTTNNDSKNPYPKGVEDWHQWEDMYRRLKQYGLMPWSSDYDKRVSKRFEETFTGKNRETINSLQSTHPWLYQFINNPSIPEDFKKSLKLDDRHPRKAREARSEAEKRARLYLQYKDDPNPLFQQVITGKLTYPKLREMYKETKKIDKATFEKYAPLATNSFGSWVSYLIE